MPSDSDLLAPFSERIAISEIDDLRKVREEALLISHWEELRECICKLPSGTSLRAQKGSIHLDLENDVVTIGEETDLTPQAHQLLHRAIELLIPWRKGPFNLFGHAIDAEWRSNLKWSRIAPALPPLRGARVADVGCGNGYYMLRMLPQEPAIVIGLDPSQQFYYTFSLLQKLLRSNALQYELLGAEHMDLFPSFFDVALCMGVLHHHRDPLGVNKKAFSLAQTRWDSDR